LNGSFQLARLAAGPGSLWESWNYDSVWTGGSLNHIM